MLSSRISSAPDSDRLGALRRGCPPRPRPRAPEASSLHQLDRPCLDRSGRLDVVVLDQCRIRQPHPVVLTAPTADGVLLQRAAAPASSCGCRGSAPWCPSTASTQRRVRVATPDRWQSRFSAVRSAVSRSRTGPVASSARRPAVPRAIGGVLLDFQPSGAGERRTRMRPPPARRPRRRRAGPGRRPSWSGPTVAGVVMSAPSARSSASARPTTCATVAGLRPASASACSTAGSIFTRSSGTASYGPRSLAQVVGNDAAVRAQPQFQVPDQASSRSG